MKRAAILLLLSGCVVEECKEDAVAMGGLCFPENLGHGSMCGNGICEKQSRPVETETACPADCDGGFQRRASFLWLMNVNFYNEHVANRQWPGAMVNASGACTDGGTATASGPIGTVGDDTSYQLSFQTSNCKVDFGTFATLVVDGGPYTDATTFNNPRETGTSQVRGSAVMSGIEDNKPFPAAPCSFDFTRVRSGTTAIFMGTFCGKELRTIFYDQ